MTSAIRKVLLLGLVVPLLLGQQCASPPGSPDDTPSDNTGDSPDGQTPNDDGTSDSGGDAPPILTGDPLSDAQRDETINTIQSFLDGRAMPDDDDGSALIQQTVDMLASRPEIAEAGSVSPSSSVWARFTDGRTLVIALNNVMPDVYEDTTPLEVVDEEEVSKVLTEAAYALPGPGPNRKVYLFNSQDVGDGEVNNHINTLSRWFTQSGYRVIVGHATVDKLEAVKDASVLYIIGHGAALGKIPTGDDKFEEVFCLGTVTPRTASNDMKYKSLLDSGQLGYLMTAYEIGGVLKFGDHEASRYFASYRFVDANWRFTDHGIVFLNMCDGFSGLARTFKEACFRQKAKIFLGWNPTTSKADIIESAGFLFHRMMGIKSNDHANVPVENPPQRPFDFASVFGEMRERQRLNKSASFLGVQRKLTESFNIHNMGHTGFALTGNAELDYVTSSGPADTILLPSIQRVDVNEREGLITAFGDFGAKQGKVSMGGTSLTVDRWQDDRVVCKLPGSGAGDVVVEVDGHKSNPRRVLLWSGTLKQKSHAIDQPAGNTETYSTFIDVTYNVSFRQDIDGFRNGPGRGIVYSGSNLPLVAMKSASSVSYTYKTTQSCCNGCVLSSESPPASIPLVDDTSTDSSFRFSGNIRVLEDGKGSVNLMFVMRAVDGASFDTTPCDGEFGKSGTNNVTLGGALRRDVTLPASLNLEYTETALSQSDVNIKPTQPIDPNAQK